MKPGGPPEGFLTTLPWKSLRNIVFCQGFGPAALHNTVFCEGSGPEALRNFVFCKSSGPNALRNIVFCEGSGREALGNNVFCAGFARNAVFYSASYMTNVTVLYGLLSQPLYYTCRAAESLSRMLARRLRLPSPESLIFGWSPASWSLDGPGIGPARVLAKSQSKTISWQSRS